MTFASISMGQYVPVRSFVHDLDPRAKLLSLMLLMLVLFPVEDPFSLGLAFLGYLGIVHVSRLPFKMLLHSCRPVLFLASVSFLFNFFAAPGSAGLLSGLTAAARLLLLVLFAVLLPLTTAPLELADALESLLSPLRRFGFPAHECAMMMSIALRFIPLLMDETDRIVKAQVSRGASLDQGGFFKRIIAFFPVLIPLFVIIFRRADELALAMESRGYRGGEGRTRRCPLVWKKNDTNATISVAGLLCLFVFARGILL